MGLEFLIVEIMSDKEKLLLCLFYWPLGSNASSFTGKLNDLTQRLSFRNQKIVFIEYFDIDLGLVNLESQVSRSQHVDLLTTCFSACLVPTIRIFTRNGE